MSERPSGQRSRWLRPKAAVFAAVGAVLWIWIRADKVIDQALSQPSAIAGSPAPAVVS